MKGMLNLKLRRTSDSPSNTKFDIR